MILKNNAESKNIIVYLAFGSLNFVEEAICSILSIFKEAKDEYNFTIKVFTDNEKYFKKCIPRKFPIEYSKITQEKFKSWTGSNGYI